MAQLAEIENVKAVKQANDDLHQARFIVEETGLDLYAGDDNIVFPFLELGGVGGVCVHTHVVGPREGDDPPAQGRRPRRGQADGRGAAAAYDLLKVVGNPIAIKAALNLLGHEVGGCDCRSSRRPTTSSSRCEAVSTASGCSSPPRALALAEDAGLLGLELRLPQRTLLAKPRRAARRARTIHWAR